MRLTIALLLACLAYSAAKEPPAVYSNVRTIPGSCEAVWPHTVAVISRHGFMPDSMDRAGGFIKLRYVRGASGWLGSDKDVKALTSYRRGALETFDRFRIVTGAMTLVADGGNCAVTIQLEYQGFKGSGFRKGWFALPSNNALESRLLEELENATLPPRATAE